MIINRYTAKGFFKYFFMIIGVVISLFTIIEYLGRAGKFIKQGMPLFDGFIFVLLNAPFIFWLVAPVACILSPIIFFGLMKRNHELVALQGGGMSLFALFRPMAVCGIITGLAVFLVAETVVPDTQSKVNAVKRKLRNKAEATTRENNIWLKDDRTIIYIGNYNAEDKTLTNMTLYTMGNDYRLERRVDAASARYENKQWILIDALEIKLDSQTGDYNTTFHKEIKESIQIAPSNLKRVLKDSEEMSIIELYRYVRLVESEGYESAKYKVDMFSKTAVPFACLFMAMMGTGIVFMRQKRDAITSNIALGTLVAFIFWFFNSFCVSLGYAGLLPSALAAWLANILFMCACGIVLIKAE